MKFLLKTILIFVCAIQAKAIQNVIWRADLFIKLEKLLKEEIDNGRDDTGDLVKYRAAIKRIIRNPNKLNKKEFLLCDENAYKVYQKKLNECKEFFETYKNSDLFHNFVGWRITGLIAIIAGTSFSGYIALEDRCIFMVMFISILTLMGIIITSMILTPLKCEACFDYVTTRINPIIELMNECLEIVKCSIPSA